MATLMLGTVFEETKDKYQLKLLAGGQGLHRSLRWMYFSEDISNADFLRGGELMLLTGHKFKGKVDFENFVKMLMERNSCGVIIPVGKYIMEEDISQELLDLCNEENYPFMIMPWKYHFPDFMQAVSRMIFASTHAQNQLAYTFQMLLKYAKIYEAEDENRLRSNQYDPAGEYCVAVIACRRAFSEQVSPSSLLYMKTLIENHLNQWPEKIFVFQYQNQIILIFHHTSCKQIGRHMGNILRFCEQSSPAYSFYCGIGSPLLGISNIKESFERACAAIQFGNFHAAHLVSFENMGLFQLLYSCQDHSIFERFVQILQPLADYDTQCNSQLVETLRLYLKYNGSVAQVSDEMYCHRNTTNYRVKKIKSVLGYDLEDGKALFRLQMAFAMLDYRAIFEPSQLH
ncbi:MAG: transcriptional regulator [Firmicutes bacterium]|nr:transcriptional regulator [Bacillota bacterium]